MKLWVNEVGPWEVSPVRDGLVAVRQGFPQVTARNHVSLRNKLFELAEKKRRRKGDDQDQRDGAADTEMRDEETGWSLLGDPAD